MKICPKCNGERPDRLPFCPNPACLAFTAYLTEKPATGGTLVHILGFKYPHKGWPDNITLGFNATVKRALISNIRFFFKNPFHPIKNAIDWLAEVYDAEYIKYQLPEQELCESAREILRTGRKFTDTEKQFKALWCVVMFWQLDDAYKFRGQDVGENLNKDALQKNVRKEIIRLIKLGLSREVAQSEEHKKKWKYLLWIVSFILLFSNVKRMVRNFLMELDINKIRPDLIDRYWMSRYFDYDFNGETLETRWAWKLEEDKTYKEPILDPKIYARIDLRPNDYFYKLARPQVEEMTNEIKGRLIEEWKCRKEKP